MQFFNINFFQDIDVVKMYKALSRLPKLIKLELLEFAIGFPGREEEANIHTLPKVTDLTIVNFEDHEFFIDFVHADQFHAANYLQMILERFPGVTMWILLLWR